MFMWYVGPLFIHVYLSMFMYIYVFIYTHPEVDRGRIGNISSLFQRSYSTYSRMAVYIHILYAGERRLFLAV